MEKLNLPFRIGMDYEELEFELEILPDRIKGYDSYLYIGKFNNFLNYVIDRTELLFRLDVLEGIVISYNLSFTACEGIITQLESLLGNPQIIFELKYKSYMFDAGNYVVLLLQVTNTTYIVVSLSNLIYPLVVSLW